MPVVEIVLEAPIHILILALVLKESVHQGEMVAILRYELGVSISGLCHFVLRSEENVGGVETGHDRENLVEDVIAGSGHEDF